MELKSVSVIMPTYNSALFIEDAVKSVLAQHYTNWELIIVDDCSTDNTKAILEPYLTQYPNIRYICLDQPSGASAARSKALQQAKGDYVAFLDSDDLWAPNKLSLQMDFMEKNHITFCATGYELIKKDGTSKWVAIIPPKKTDYDKMLRLSCPIGNSTVMYNRRIIGDLQIPTFEKLDNFALCLQILHQTEACYGLSDILGQYRARSQSAGWDKIKLLSYHWHLCHHIEKLGYIKTAWYLLCGWVVKVTGIGINKINLRHPKRDIEDSVVYYE